MKVNGYEITPYAYLRDANLVNVDLRGAHLVNAYLVNANLEGAYLVNADLRCADLVNAYLVNANLEGAYLVNADLRGADLRGANLENTKLPDFQLPPEEGSFIAYKKVDSGVIKILIPEDAKRTSSLVSRNCRASHVKVLEGSGFSSTYINNKLEYKEGEVVYADGFNDDIRVYCTSGIHFFMTRKEAEEWS